MKLLILGHAQHGKDTVAELLQDMMGLKFQSSSLYVLDKFIWKAWGEERFKSPADCYQQRDNYRDTWKNLIKAYNTPELTRVHREMLIEDGFDMYVGMRDKEEFAAAMKADLFDYVIYVDRSSNKPLEKTMEIPSAVADFVVDNNGNIDDLFEEVERLTEQINDAEQVKKMQETKEPEKEEEAPKVDLMAVPEGATKLLDHGYIVTSEVGGSDAKIAQAARQSYGMGTKTLRSNAGLIRYLVANHHTSPLEMGNLTFQMRLPIFVMRQLVRHRTAKLNEYSGRYSEMPRLFYIPSLDQIKAQHKTNKQMSGEALSTHAAKVAQEIMIRSSKASFDDYENLLGMGVSRETARIILPLNIYTVVTWQMDISNLIKFLYLRDDEHAQWEIRVYAQEIAKAVEEHFPDVYAAYLRERQSTKLSLPQITALITNNTFGLPVSEKEQLENLVHQVTGHASVFDHYDPETAETHGDYIMVRG